MWKHATTIICALWINKVGMRDCDLPHSLTCSFRECRLRFFWLFWASTQTAWRVHKINWYSSNSFRMGIIRVFYFWCAYRNRVWRDFRSERKPIIILVYRFHVNYKIKEKFQLTFSKKVPGNKATSTSPSLFICRLLLRNRFFVSRYSGEYLGSDFSILRVIRKLQYFF